MRNPVRAATFDRTSLVMRIALIVTGSIVIALAARLRIDLPFSPVPITLQTGIVALVGATLGARAGAIAAALYLVEGLAGAPVFAGGASGLAYALGPTGGFLVGFIPAAFLAGWLVETGRARTALTVPLAFAASMLVVYLFGVPWLANVVGIDRALAVGFVPYLPGDAIKAIAASALWFAGARLSRPT